ncbi:energy transducer TonB [Phenylobacterium sp.]|uniref:energy transducer TonB n=1 Tax=Phenylobacterium sp. TaxID=1871053 RepID=UPI002C1A29BD|nr:energy transducer TonB [Phenylobacterium sp.]HVI34391.1 energy transducer TonB [Phenylobacterium sp.]
MRRPVLALLAILAAAPVLAAQAPGPKAPAADGPPDTEPDWRRRPTPEMLRAVWPTEAWKRGQGGKAIIACKVSIQGVLFDCKVDEETPKGSGFGVAALSMTPQLLMKPATKDGKPVIGDVRIPLNFVMPGGPAAGGNPTFGTRPVVPVGQAWPQAPSYQDVVAAYPEKARAARVGGVATLQCDVREQEFRRCQVIREEPKGHGFAAAARSLVGKFRTQATGADGKPVNATIQIPFAFSPDMLDASRPPVIGKPTWAKLPTAEALRTAFPAETAGGTVRVRLSCNVEQGGSVSGCEVVSEEPAGRGYGAAALKIASEFMLDTWTVEGFPTVGGTVQIPIRFELGPPKPATPPPAAKK